MSRNAVWSFFGASMLAIAAWGQSITGSITGVVRDPSGAAVAGAEVRLTNAGTGITQRTTSSDTGDYRFLLLPSGSYRIEVARSGFKTFRRDGIIVEVDRSLAVPVTLEIGEVTETVEVVAGTPLLEPNTSSLGTVMDQRKVEDLPLNGRNPMGLANLIPTVRGIGYFGGQLLSTWRMGQVTIAGGGPLANGFMIDGIANEKMTDFSAMTFLSVDATQEFKVLTNAMSAAARSLRWTAIAAHSERAHGGWGGAGGDRSSHHRVWLHSKPCGGSGRESHSPGQSVGIGVAVCALPAPPRFVFRPGALAGRLSAGVRRMGSAGSGSVPASFRLPLNFGDRLRNPEILHGRHLA